MKKAKIQNAPVLHPPYLRFCLFTGSETHAIIYTVKSADQRVLDEKIRCYQVNVNG